MSPPTPARSAETRTRVAVGIVLILLIGGVLFLDQAFAPYYPCLLACVLGLGLLACLELYQLLGALPRPPLWLCLSGVAAVILANWPAHVFAPDKADPWRHVAYAFAAFTLAAFLVEMARYPGPGQSVTRVALAVWVVAYLGVLPSFLAQLRWWPRAAGETGADWRGVGALALTIFVPKFGDIGAYFTGRLLGRHRMTPALSPKKTWEGLAGGLLLAALTAAALHRALPQPLLAGGDLEAVAFGLALGVAGVLGDLAESLIKRDFGHKDAAKTLPGFGGVLDVVDSLLFAAPVAYWWLRN